MSDWKKTKKQLLDELEELRLRSGILEERIREETARDREKEQFLIQQSRLATMGEMTGNIAHQWRQPLTTVSLLVQDISECYYYGKFTEEYLDATVDKIVEVIQYMSRTIDDFHHFIKPDRTKTQFLVKEAVENVLSFLEASLKYNEIAVETEIESGLSIKGYRNEYSQALMNIISNAKETFIERQIPSPQISINGLRKHNRTVVTITDNSGGISEEIIDRLSDPFLNTGSAMPGNGTRLYISGIIIRKNPHGNLTVRNTGKGTEFMIEV
jgi:C4-dicarboxylate-specific signal transduction histidine kinase